MKRKSRQLKQLELTIRFGRQGAPDHPALVWDVYFSTKDHDAPPVKYPLPRLLQMDHEELKAVIDEYFFRVYLIIGLRTPGFRYVDESLVALPSHETTIVAAFAPIGQNSWIWKCRAFAKPTNTGWTPTPEQGAQGIGRSLLACAAGSTTRPLEQRIVAYHRCGVTLTCYQQQAELPDLKAALPEYAAIHSQVLQDVLARLDKTYQAFFRRVREGQTPGFPRFQGRNRYNSFTYKQFGNGATLDNGFLVLSKIGRIAVRWSRPMEGAYKTVTISKEADGWYVCFSCADVPLHPLPAMGQETGIDLGIEAFATLSNGTRIFNPGWYRKAERALKTAQRRVSRRKKGSNRRRKAVNLLAKAHQKVRRQRQDFHHKTALATRTRATTRSITRISNLPTW